ncbi:LacI family DNA-binding transcriptional regulator [Actinomadura decatromicini]|uniref:LacI family DNA-binding transcriptional regulator n=1 Tax=Actinomadura decatromicini TaxID=2604572 RepID=A0A5D3FXZ1_9ACTN|nr:LacI family DNA-binding transcriptional regulator [Actinomadura decatromicini]
MRGEVKAADVARRACVGIGTVSNVLNDPGRSLRDVTRKAARGRPGHRSRGALLRTGFGTRVVAAIAGGRSGRSPPARRAGKGKGTIRRSSHGIPTESVSALHAKPRKGA